MSGMVGASRSLLSSRLVSILISRSSGHIISAFSRHKLSYTVCLSPPLAGSSHLPLSLSAVAHGARCLKEQDTCQWVHPSWPNRKLQPILFAVFLLAYVVTVGAMSAFWLPSLWSPNSTLLCIISGGACFCWTLVASLSPFPKCWHVSWTTNAEFPMHPAFHSSSGQCGLSSLDNHGLWPLPGHLPTPHL